MQVPWGAVMTLIIYIIGSTFGFVWWMATITEKLNSALSKLREINENNAMYAKKEEVARELGIMERNQQAMWAKLDKLKEKVDTGGI